MDMIEEYDTEAEAIERATAEHRANAAWTISVVESRGKFSVERGPSLIRSFERLVIEFPAVTL